MNPQMMMNYQHPNFNYANFKDSTLYIGDLDEAVTSDILFAFYSSYGQLNGARVMKNASTQKSRGYGFVTFFSKQDAERARIASNHNILLRKPIRVCYKKHMREIEKDANVFLKEIDPEIKIGEIDEVFAQFGTIFSSKINTDEEGKSVGYGYVQFEKREEADLCFSNSKNGKIKVGSKEVLIERFVPYNSRDSESQKRNLYLKNFPADLTEEKLKEEIIEKLGVYGKITSSMVKKCTELNKSFAFVCFETHEAAMKALEELSKLETNPFGSEEKLYVVWALSSESRKRQLRKMPSQPMAISETNLFLKNLKTTTSEEDLKKCFSLYGEISSVRIKSPSSSETNRKFPTTNFGFISFVNKEDAKKALETAQKNPDVQILFETIYGSQPSVYISFHMNATSYKIVKESKQRSIYYSMVMRGMRFMEPMMMPMMNPMMNPNMNNQQFRGAYQRPRGVQRRPFDGYRRPRPQESRPQRQEPVVQEKPTIKTIKSDLSSFLAQTPEKQRMILGELLFPLVSKYVDSSEKAPKVTGMLIDLEVFEIQEIIDCIENDDVLQERVKEAISLLEEEN